MTSIFKQSLFSTFSLLYFSCYVCVLNLIVIKIRSKWLQFECCIPQFIYFYGVNTIVFGSYIRSQITADIISRLAWLASTPVMKPFWIPNLNWFCSSVCRFVLSVFCLILVWFPSPLYTFPLLPFFLSRHIFTLTGSRIGRFTWSCK